MTREEPGSRGDEKTAEFSSARPSDSGSSREEMPKRIGPYTIHSVLGQGGMGIVYSGSRDDGQFAQRAAIKVIKRGFDTDEVLKRFEVERQVLSALNHSNIARVYEGGLTDDGRPYFAMEYIEGTTLLEYCDRNRLSTRERLELFRKICDAVQYAHQNLIVHRDLKPSNIIVSPTGEPKLLDFGIAKLLNAPLFQARVITGAMMRLMTPEYASPEQVRGDPVGTPSDVYSLGVLLYELLTGRRPYSFGSRIEQEIVRVVCEVDPERPSTAATHAASVLKADGSTEEISAETFAKVRDGEPSRLKRMLRGDVDLIMLKSLEKTARRRYQTAEQLSDDIVRYLSGMPIEARPPSAVYKAGKFFRRNRAGVIAAALVFLSLIVGVGATTSQWIRAEAALEVAESERLRAEEALEVARRSSDVSLELAQELVVQLPQQLNKLSGSLEARKDIAEISINALKRLDDILDDRRSLESALTIAAAYQRLARVHDDTRNPSIGETDKATELHRTAMALFEEILTSDSDQSSAEIGVASGSIYLGDLAAKQGKIAEAEQHYMASIERLDRLARDPALALRVAPRRAGANEAMAKLAALRGDPQSALRLRRENLAFRIRTLDTAQALASPEQRRIARRNISAGHIDVADTLLELGRYDEALVSYTESVRIREQLLEESPESGRAPRDLAYALAYEAFAASLSEQTDLALDHAFSALSLMRSVFDQDALGETEDQRNRRFLCEILIIASRVVRGEGETDQTLADEAVEIIEPVLVRAPDESQTVRLFAAARIEQARARLAIGERGVAETICSGVLVRLQDLLASAPDDRRVELQILETLATRAQTFDAESNGENRERERQAIAETLRLAARLLKNGPLPAPLQELLDELPES